MSKKQWKLVTQDLPCTFSTKSNWSQDESDSTTRDVSEIRSVLPTKTSATRQISDLENIPQNGPFLLNFSNIPYEADENAIRHFFQAYEVVNVTKSEIKRGTGIIEFKDLNSLSGALGMAEKTFISRPIRLTIGLPEDLNRIKTGRQQSGRYQNQQRNQPPTINEDSDNWRVKKSQPTPQPSTDNNYPPRNDRSNWRDKQPTIRNEDKVVPENSENWRRVTNREPKSANFNRRNPTMQDNTKPIISLGERTEPKDDLVKETKKVSIFGDAKPVDTQSKDLEIEEKIAQQKKQVTDETATKTENSPGNNPWTPKKPIPQNSATVEKSDTLDCRGTKAPSVRIKLNVAVNQPVKPPEPTKPEPAEPSKMEPQPAATPSVNIWVERLKAKGKSPTTTQVNRNNSASKPGFDKSLSSQSQCLPTEKKPDPNPPIDQQQTSQVASNNAQSSSQSNAVTTELKAAQKPPVVISVNGPFLDPKSRTPHHSMSDISSNKTPTAVPISKSSSPSDNYKDPIDPRSPSKPLSSALSPSSELQQQSKQQQQPTNAPINACGKQSSWAKGPPKGLLEKTEINQ